MLRCTYFLLSLLCTLQRLNDAREIMSLVLVVNTLLSISFFLSLFSFFYFKSALFETKKEKKKMAIFQYLSKRNVDRTFDEQRWFE